MSDASRPIETFDRTPPLYAGHQSHPRANRVSINLRWLVGISLMGATATALLLGTLCRALSTTAFPVEPSIVRRFGDHHMSELQGRGDRVTLPEPVGPAPTVQVQVEQVGSTGQGVKPFTYLSAALDRVVPGPAPVAAAIPPADGPDGAAAQDNFNRAGFGGLPPQILYGSSHADPPPDLRAYAAVEGPSVEPGPMGVPLNVTSVPRTLRQATSDRVIVAQRGDRLDVVLSLLGLPDTTAQEIDWAFSPAFGGRKAEFLGGEQIHVASLAEAIPGGPARPYEVAVEHPDGASETVAPSDAGRYVQAAQPEPKDARSRGGRGRNAPSGAAESGLSVRDSLRAMADRKDIDPVLVDELLRVSETDLDLSRPVSAKDHAELLFSPQSPAGSGEPELTFAALTLNGKKRRFYRFDAPDDGSVDFYDETGRSVTKFLMRKPVTAGRLGDGFGWRTHPVLGDRRFHEGVDYAAPYGSPIVAAGAGVVEKIDREWGYGKYIRIRHDLGYETTYAHVAGFPSIMKVGKRVRQGETIAYIGSTGLSTGPHLYYEVRINGHNVDPLSIRLAAGRILEGDALASFEARRQRTDVLLDASAGQASAH